MSSPSIKRNYMPKEVKQQASQNEESANFWLRNPQGISVYALLDTNDKDGDDVVAMAEEVRKLDSSGDGFLSKDEFHAGVYKTIKRQESNRQLLRIFAILLGLLMIVCATLGGIIYAITELSKEIQVSETGEIQNKEGKAAKAANTDIGVGSEKDPEERTNLKARKSSKTVATDLVRSNRKPFDLKDLFEMPPDALGDVKKLSIPHKGEVLSIGVKGVTTRQGVNPQKKVTVQRLAFTTTEAEFSYLFVFKHTFDVTPPQVVVNFMLLTEHGAEQLQMFNFTGGDIEFANRMGYGRRKLSSADEEHVAEVARVRRELLDMVDPIERAWLSMDANKTAELIRDRHVIIMDRPKPRTAAQAHAAHGQQHVQFGHTPASTSKHVAERKLLFWGKAARWVQKAAKTVVNTVSNVVTTVVETVTNVVNTGRDMVTNCPTDPNPVSCVGQKAEEIVQHVAKGVNEVAADLGVDLDVIGSVIDFLFKQMNIEGIVNDLKNLAMTYLGDFLEFMADNVDWLPFSGGRLDEMIQSTFTSLYDTVMDETKSFLTRMNAELMQWIDLDEEKRICMSPKTNAMATLEYTSPDGNTVISMKMPRNENCAGLLLNKVVVDNGAVQRTLNDILVNNPIADIVNRIAEMMLKEIPSALVKMYQDLETQILNFVEDIFGSGARNSLKEQFDKIGVTVEAIKNNMDATHKKIYDARDAIMQGRRRALQSVLEGLPSSAGTIQHIRKLMLHHTATPFEREIFEEILHNVTTDILNETMHNLYGIKKAPPATGTNTTERRQLLDFSLSDITNLVWFKSLPVSAKVGVDLNFRQKLHFIVDESGDLMREFNVPTINFDHEFGIATAMSVKIALKMILRLPYSFKFVADNVEIEAALRAYGEIMVDVATGEVKALIDTSREGKTGIRVNSGSVAGHAFMAFEIELGATVGACLASFCFELDVDYKHDVLALGFDMLAESNVGSGSSMTPTQIEKELQTQNKYYKYPLADFGEAAKCTSDADGEYFVGGGYVVARWPQAQIKLKSPSVDGGDSGMSYKIQDSTLFRWNYPDYNPNVLETDFIPNSASQPFGKWLYDLASQYIPPEAGAIMAYVGYDPESTKMSMVDLANDAGDFLNNLVANGVSAVGGPPTNQLPDNPFELASGLACSRDSLPNENLRVVMPFYSGPILEGVKNEVQSRRRELLAENGVSEPKLHNLLTGKEHDGSCRRSRELCSQSSHCCGTLVCAHTRNSHWPSCVNDDEDDEDIVMKLA